ncbi:polysaccharide deacetylase family protein [Kitasatospora sp. NBC_01266]|uniref:polysaccharide deacetylase family protein n=1 Tax=Kitasatospora sp. NBC_01266 TaxID=2903572 RepID=UPI002E37BB07|nr:polysaccharide deacetylase family protein [Kitasatospora sp. NBC_01266]
MMFSQIQTTRRLLFTAGGASLLCACGRRAHAKGAAPVPVHPSAPASPTPTAPTPSPTPSATPSAGPASPTAALNVPAGSGAVAAGHPETGVHAGPKVIALTFDDGPSPIDTPHVLALLREHGVTATFFMIGKNVARYPDTAREVVEAGHLVGNHTWSHPDLGTLSRSGVHREIERTSETIAGICGVRPVLFRAPGGHFTRNSYAVCADLGLRSICWNVDPEDWSDPGVGTIASRVLTATRTGSIVLNHDGCLTDNLITAPGGPGDRSQTVDALRAYLPKLLEAGYRFTVPDNS